ncbi:sigma-70 family RNA polymerase sigma factor [Clostridium sporogenes]|uniref:RNA polymerase sigma factor n=1 Tax=Clostridium sporogenes TaxID=1509 RepID=A0AAE4FHC8_CLOSG|nr:sigma-70 family RNA polymerase sigma factor [Clostridium sporogenes]MDS1002306.1 sigma-70 family RNA polymerase sigma factor [Clostridium sporogenes]
MTVIEKEQFGDFIKQYERLIITICLSFTKNYFDAEDLAQQTFLAAYQNYERFDGKNLKTWLTTIAANKCKDYLKSKERTTVSLSEKHYEGLKDHRDSPEETVVKKNTSERIYRLCNKLKEPYKTVAISYFCKDIKLSHLAKETGKNIKTLETQLYRSKKLLKDLWKEEFM